MPEKVRWSTSVEVQNGPTFNLGGVMQSEAYAKIRVDVQPGEDEAVSILPSGVAAKFLLVRASKYVDATDAGKKLTYAVGSASETDLSGPIVLTDAAVLSLLGSDLTEVTFKNGMTELVTVEILVCRDAGPTA